MATLGNVVGQIAKKAVYNPKPKKEEPKEPVGQKAVDQFLKDNEARNLKNAANQSMKQTEALTNPPKVIVHPNGSITQITYNQDGSTNYADYSKEDWNKKIGLETGKGGGMLSPEQQLNQSNEDRAAFMQRMEQGLGTDKQQAEYKAALANASLPERQAQLDALINKYANMPVEEMQKSSNPANMAGFAASGLVGSASSIGSGVAGGAIVGSVVPVIGTATGAAIGAAIAVGGSLLANQGKGRAQDITNAKRQSAEARRQLGLLKTRALNPLEDQESIIREMYGYQNAITAAERMLYDRSLIDTAFRIDSGADELYQIEIYKQTLQSTQNQIMYNLLNKDENKYNAQIGAAIQNYQNSAGSEQ